MSMANWVRGCLMAAMAAGGISVCLPAVAAGPRYSALIVYGDSLSDVGNNGRSISAPLWDEQLAGAYGLPLTASSAGGTDYAMGSALITQDRGTILSLPNQVAAYLAVHPAADPQALYAIWGGANDVLSTLGHPKTGPQVAAAGVADTVAMVTALYSAGARYFVIADVPRTDLTPYVQGLGSNAIVQQANLVALWNRNLWAALSPRQWPGAHLWHLDDASEMQGIFSTPAQFGFTNVTTPCNQTCANPLQTLFWTEIHVGAMAHSLVGFAVLGLLSQ